MPLLYDIDGLGSDTRRVAGRLARLRTAVRNHPTDPAQSVPEKNVSDTLLLATWNLQAFEGGDADNRTEESYWYIAEIVSHFDLIAIQEVGANLGAVTKLQNRLGPTWEFVVTDVTKGRRGNEERLAFLFDTRKVRFGGVAGEVVVAPVEDSQGRTIAPSNQLARTPSIVGFQAGWFRFMLCTVHIIWGSSVANQPLRVAEVNQLASFLRSRSEDDNAWSQNLILLGDFNIFSRDAGNDTFAALANNGFDVPPALQHVPATNVGRTARFYDQIAMRVRPNDLTSTGRGGVFDYYAVVYRAQDYDDHVPAMSAGLADQDPDNPLTFDTRGNPRSQTQRERYYRNHWRRRQMSDHLPMWVELRIDHGESYLARRSN